MRCKNRKIMNGGFIALLIALVISQPLGIWFAAKVVFDWNWTVRQFWTRIGWWLVLVLIISLYKLFTV